MPSTDERCVASNPDSHFKLDPATGVEIISASPWCVAVLDSGGRVDFMNDAGLALFDISASDAVGRSVSSFWDGDAAARISDIVRDVAGGASAASFSGLASSPDGGLRCLEANISGLKAPDGRVRSLVCSIRDISEFASVEKSLELSEQRFRALADNMAQLAWMADSTGSIFWYNKRWFDFTGTTLPQMEGWGWKSVHHPDHVSRVVEKFSAHIESGAVWEDVFPLRGADGTYRWFLSRALPIRDEAGNITLWCGTNTDITEQRAATQRLRQKARLIQLSHEAIFSWELDGTILSWNRGCEELYKITQDEAVGARGTDILKSRFPLPYPALLDILRTNGAWSGEIEQTAKDGSHVWVESRLEVLKVGGRQIVLETNRDVTERRRADEIQKLLVAELNHRVKNTLAIVQSIAAQTARSSPNMECFVKSFRGRVQSLSSAHNVLTDAHWYGADLRTLVAAEIDVTAGGNANVHIEGDSVFLPPQTALQVTLMMHELATNALRHGALTVPGGRVSISWQRLAGQDGKIEILWRESGGPRVEAPSHIGFGTTLIERSGTIPNIKTALAFGAGGVACRITIDRPPAGSAEQQMFNPVRTAAPLRSDETVVNPVFAARQGLHTVLIIEDEPLVALEMEETLIDAGYLPAGPATTLASALQALDRGGITAAIVDGNMLGSPIDIIIRKLEAVGVPYILLVRQDTASVKVPSNVPVLRHPLRSTSLIAALKGLTGVPPAPSPERR